MTDATEIEIQLMPAEEESKSLEGEENFENDDGNIEFVGFEEQM